MWKMHRGRWAPADRRAVRELMKARLAGEVGACDLRWAADYEVKLQRMRRLWDELERRDLVKLESYPDTEEPDLSWAEGKVLEREKERIELDGLWIRAAHFWNPEDEEWELGDSCGGIVGNDDHMDDEVKWETLRLLKLATAGCQRREARHTC